MRYLCAQLAALCVVLTALPALADNSVPINLTGMCKNVPDGTPVSANISVNGAASFRADGFQWLSLRDGANTIDIRVLVPEGKNWAIQEITERNQDANTITVLQQPNTVNTTLQYKSAGVAALDVAVDTCAQKVKLQIITTTSCNGLDGEAFTVQGGVAVNLGGQSYTSNDKGIIEVEVPPGDYDLAAEWHGAALAYVRQDNAAVANKRPETGIPYVRLAEARELLEVRLATCEANGAGIVRATVTEIGDGGSIQIERHNTKAIFFVGAQLRDGDIVTIKGLAKLQWEDGHVISFEHPMGRTVIVIGPTKKVPVGTKPGGGTDYRPSTLEILQGVGRFLLPKREPEAEGKFLPSAKYIVPVVKGTEFLLGHDEATDTDTLVLISGLVTVVPLDTALPHFDLHPGEAVTATTAGVGPIVPGNGQGGDGTVAAPISSVEPVPAGTYLGCFADTFDLDLNGYLEHTPTNRHEACFATCKAKGFKFMGLQYGESCLCGDSYGKYGEVDEAQCNYRCTGNPEEICGGYATNSIYTTGN